MKWTVRLPNWLVQRILAVVGAHVLIRQKPHFLPLQPELCLFVRRFAGDEVTGRFGRRVKALSQIRQPELETRRAEGWLGVVVSARCADFGPQARPYSLTCLFLPTPAFWPPKCRFLGF